MWAEVAKQGGLGSKQAEEKKVEEVEKEEVLKSKPQEDAAPEPLPKDSEKQEILSAVAALPPDAVNDISNEIEKKEEQKVQDQVAEQVLAA